MPGDERLRVAETRRVIETRLDRAQPDTLFAEYNSPRKLSMTP
jgi:hypothetical protein